MYKETFYSSAEHCRANIKVETRYPPRPPRANKHDYDILTLFNLLLLHTCAADDDSYYYYYRTVQSI